MHRIGIGPTIAVVAAAVTAAIGVVAVAGTTDGVDCGGAGPGTVSGGVTLDAREISNNYNTTGNRLLMRVGDNLLPFTLIADKWLDRRKPEVDDQH